MSLSTCSHAFDPTTSTSGDIIDVHDASLSLQLVSSALADRELHCAYPDLLGSAAFVIAGALYDTYTRSR